MEESYTPIFHFINILLPNSFLPCITQPRGGYRLNHDIRTFLEIVPHPLTTPTLLKFHTVQQPNRKLLANYSLQIKIQALFQLQFTHGDKPLL